VKLVEGERDAADRIVLVYRNTGGVHQKSEGGRLRGRYIKASVMTCVRTENRPIVSGIAQVLGLHMNFLPELDLAPRSDAGAHQVKPRFSAARGCQARLLADYN